MRKFSPWLLALLQTAPDYLRPFLSTAFPPGVHSAICCATLPTYPHGRVHTAWRPCGCSRKGQTCFPSFHQYRHICCLFYLLLVLLLVLLSQSTHGHAARITIPSATSRAEGARICTPTAGLQLLVLLSSQRESSDDGGTAYLSAAPGPGGVSLPPNSAHDHTPVAGLQLLLYFPGSATTSPDLRAATPSPSKSSDDGVAQHPSMLNQRLVAIDPHRTLLAPRF